MAADAEKPTKERVPFNVYGTLLILSSAALLGAVLLLNNELTMHWKFWPDKTDARAMSQAEHQTYINDLTDDWEKVPYVKVRDVDRHEWDMIHPGEKFPVDNYEWPAGYDVLKYPVKADTDNLKEIPEAQINALMSAPRNVEIQAPSTAPVVTPSGTQPAGLAPAAPAAPATPAAPAAAPKAP